MSETKQRLWDAIRILATENNPLNNRLETVYNLYLIYLRTEDFPEDLKVDFRALARRITPIPGDKPGQYFDSMDVKTRQALARDICDLYEKLIRQ